MTSVSRVIVIAGGAVLFLDVVGALASQQFGFSYASLSPLSFLVYAVAGFGAGRLVGWKAGIVAGAGTALIEATLGWALSWLIGPGRPPDGFTGVAPILFAVVTVTLTGALFGLVGGGLAQLGQPSKRAAA